MKTHLKTVFIIAWIVFWLLLYVSYFGYVPSEGGSLAADLYEAMEIMYGEPYSESITQGHEMQLLPDEQYESMYFDLDFQKTCRFKKGTTVARIADRLGTESTELVAEVLDMDVSNNIPVEKLTIPAAYKIDLYHVEAIYERWTVEPDPNTGNEDDISCRKIVTHLAINVQDTNHRGAIVSDARIAYSPDDSEKNSFM